MAKSYRVELVVEIESESATAAAEAFYIWLKNGELDHSVVTVIGDGEAQEIGPDDLEMSE